jgi:DNA-binding MarR family transcriptional regulator
MLSRGSPDYAALAELRYHLRLFLGFSDRAAKACGLEPGQHQCLLALKGLPPGVPPTVKAVADRLGLRHHSVVELVDRMARKALVRRERGAKDGREVWLSLTRRGEQVLRRLSLAHEDELRLHGPALVESLSTLLVDEAAASGARP